MKDNFRDMLEKTVGGGHPPKGSSGRPERSQGGGKPGKVVSPDDERGTKYPGDIKNPLDGTYKGCF